MGLKAPVPDSPAVLWKVGSPNLRPKIGRRPKLCFIRVLWPISPRYGRRFENLLSIVRCASQVKVWPVSQFIRRCRKREISFPLGNELSLLENSFGEIVADIIVETLGSLWTKTFGIILDMYHVALFDHSAWNYVEKFRL